MPRRKKERPPTEAAIKSAADRAEGLPADDAAENTAPVGRPALFKTEYIEQVAKLCQLGATDIEIARFFNISTRTLHHWKLKYPEFVSSVKAAKEAADERVERSLYQKATGYTFESEKIFQYEGQVVRAKTVEHVPPSDTAMIFWLKNRRPDKWRDVHKHEVGGPGDFSSKSDAELLQEIAADAAELGLSVPKEYTEH